MITTTATTRYTCYSRGQLRSVFGRSPTAPLHGSLCTASAQHSSSLWPLSAAAPRVRPTPPSAPSPPSPSRSRGGDSLPTTAIGPQAAHWFCTASPDTVPWHRHWRWPPRWRGSSTPAGRSSPRPIASRTQLRRDRRNTARRYVCMIFRRPSRRCPWLMLRMIPGRCGKQCQWLGDRRVMSCDCEYVGGTWQRAMGREGSVA
jgi:hypothetical protein